MKWNKDQTHRGCDPTLSCQSYWNYSLNKWTTVTLRLMLGVLVIIWIGWVLILIYNHNISLFPFDVFML